MATKAPAITAEELAGLADDGMRRELVDGGVRVMAPAGAEHGRVASTVNALLFSHVREGGLGVTFGAETGFLLARDPDTVRAPDAAFVAARRAEEVGRTDRYWPGPPNFAAEIVSPGDTFADVEAKVLSWVAAGTVVALVIDPARSTATAYRGSGDVRFHSGEEALDLTDAVPGWRVALADFFG